MGNTKFVNGAAILLFLMIISKAQSQEELSKKFFIGYETLEMTMNKFQYFAGEIGYRFNPKHQVSLSIGEVDLTERHLASNEAAAVDGDDVEGYFRIYEINYNRFFGQRKVWHYGANVGYVNDKYDHLISDNKINNETFTAGFNFGYQKMDLFNIKHLYIHAMLPVRFYFNSIPEQKWGETTINEHKFVNNIWFFVGYRF